MFDTTVVFFFCSSLTFWCLSRNIANSLFARMCHWWTRFVVCSVVGCVELLDVVGALFALSCPVHCKIGLFKTSASCVNILTCSFLSQTNSSCFIFNISVRSATARMIWSPSEMAGVMRELGKHGTCPLTVLLGLVTF